MFLLVVWERRWQWWVLTGRDDVVIVDAALRWAIYVLSFRNCEMVSGSELRTTTIAHPALT
ncbi:hypothetical protein COCVIDRAFT_111125 [Bipolaris victoriae FI3]|uniref:Uncharacterized protein n=1 Tax=Bipolaris victoriae (strain FI3) TaxID=930091 RepID=W7E9F0_BIPV3|nr:hypothetical protein COCVIDRAFT_111125 [Bipolaris victoriae FI3]